MACTLCEHPSREEIEKKLMENEHTDGFVEELANEYALSELDVRDHILFHNNPSIARQVKMHETDMLMAASEDYLKTLQIVGSKIRGLNDEDSEIKLFKYLSKPAVDLYTGSGEALRRNVQAIAEINQLLNGPKDNGSDGLIALATVLHSSIAEASEE